MHSLLSSLDVHGKCLQGGNFRSIEAVLPDALTVNSSDSTHIVAGIKPRDAESSAICYWEMGTTYSVINQQIINVRLIFLENFVVAKFMSSLINLFEGIYHVLKFFFSALTLLVG